MNANQGLTPAKMNIGSAVSIIIPMDDERAEELSLYDEIPAIITDVTDGVVSLSTTKHDAKQMSMQACSGAPGEYVAYVSPVTPNLLTEAQEAVVNGRQSNFTAEWFEDIQEWVHAGDVQVQFFPGANRSVAWSEGAIHPWRLDESGARLKVEEVRQDTWFHATERANWGEALASIKDADGYPLMVHVGSHEAALTRMSDILLHRESGEEGDIVGWMFELRMSADANVFEYMLDDIRAEWWQGWSTAVHGEAEVFGYVNDFEDDGSVSLYARASIFELVSATPLKRSDVRDASSEESNRNTTRMMVA